MILYLDASAAVKRYVQELGSAEVSRAVEQAEIVGIALIGQAEIAAALARAARMAVLTQAEAEAVFQALEADWPDYVRIRVTERLIARASRLVWRYALRGYDAVHLAAAGEWQDGLSQPVTVATFDRQLWEAARQEGFPILPVDLGALLALWQGG